MPTNLFQRAHKFYSKGNLRKAEDCCKLAIANNPGDYEAYNLLGVMAINAKKFGDAHAYLQKALGINKDYAEGYNSLGVLYTDNLLYEDAKKILEVAIKIKPDYAEAYYNYGKILFEEKQYPLAKHNYEIALSYKPKYAEAYNNIGNILYKNGELEASIEYYNHALSIDPNIIEAVINKSLALLYTKGTQEWNSYLEVYAASAIKLPPQGAQLISFLAIANWLEGNTEKAKHYNERTRSLLRSLQIQIHNKKEIWAYTNFLRLLIEWYEKNTNYFLKYSNVNKNIYFIGESHSITCAGKGLEIGDKIYNCCNRFLMGCQIAHLVSDRFNPYKIAFKNAVSSLLSGDIIILTIGEIDNRWNYGIFKRYMQKNIHWQETIDSLVKQYFSKIVIPLKQKGFITVIWGVPAPHLLQVENLPKYLQAEYAESVKYFNNRINVFCNEHGIAFIDNYANTVTENAFAKEDARIDYFHLRPDVFADGVIMTLINRSF